MLGPSARDVKTPLIELVPLAVGHSADLAALAALGDETMPPLSSRQAMLGFVAQAQRLRARGSRETFAIRDAGRLVGIAVLARDPTSPDRAELGYWIGQPHQGRGYATAAARRLVSHAFDRLRLALVFARCPSANPASVRVVERLGFRLVGVEPVAGGPVGRYEVTRGEWSARLSE